jgi:hypothetical protein
MMDPVAAGRPESLGHQTRRMGCDWMQLIVAVGFSAQTPACCSVFKAPIGLLVEGADPWYFYLTSSSGQRHFSTSLFFIRDIKYFPSSATCPLIHQNEAFYNHSRGDIWCSQHCLRRRRKVRTAQLRRSPLRILEIAPTPSSSNKQQSIPHNPRLDILLHRNWPRSQLYKLGCDRLRRASIAAPRCEYYREVQEPNNGQGTISHSRRVGRY